MQDYGLETVQEYMYHIRANAEMSVRNLLRDVVQRTGSATLQAVDYLDDGSPIQLKVDIDESTGSAVLDFSGTGCEVRGNLNAPISVVHSAVIYCMRSMLDLDIPLNAGCLVPLESALLPSYLAAEAVPDAKQSRSLQSHCSRHLAQQPSAVGTFSLRSGS